MCKVRPYKEIEARALTRLGFPPKGMIPVLCREASAVLKQEQAVLDKIMGV